MNKNEQLSGCTSRFCVHSVGNIRKENGEPVYKQINAYNIYKKKQERILKK